MSRIGREPITIPAGVTITNQGGVITVKGPKGELTKKFHAHLGFEEKDGKFHVTRPDDSLELKMNHGTARALINDMVKGVTDGFSKTLEIKGVGYLPLRCCSPYRWCQDLHQYQDHGNLSRRHRQAARRPAGSGDPQCPQARVLSRKGHPLQRRSRHLTSACFREEVWRLIEEEMKNV